MINEKKKKNKILPVFFFYGYSYKIPEIFHSITSGQLFAQLFGGPLDSLCEYDIWIDDEKLLTEEDDLNVLFEKRIPLYIYPKRILDIPEFKNECFFFICQNIQVHTQIYWDHDIFDEIVQQIVNDNLKLDDNKKLQDICDSIK